MRAMRSSASIWCTPKRQSNTTTILMISFCFAMLWLIVVIQVQLLTRSNVRVDNNRVAGRRKHSGKAIETVMNVSRKESCTWYSKCQRVTHLPTGIDEACEFDVTNDTHYLPDLKLIECVSGNMKTDYFKDRNALIARFERVQNPEECDAPKSSLKDSSWHTLKFTSHGHGINAFVMAWNIGNHIDRRIPVVASTSAYRFGSHHESCFGRTPVHRGWSCHLSPLSGACDLYDEKTRQATVNFNRLDRPIPFKDWCLPNGQYDFTFGRCRCSLDYLPSEDGTYCLSYNNDEMFKDKSKWSQRYRHYHDGLHNDKLDDDYAMLSTEHWVSRLSPGEVFPLENSDDPAHWTYKKFMRRYPDANPFRYKLKNGFFWWMLQYMWILHKDAPKRAEMERKVKELIGHNTECVAVHVRRGDSCHDVTAKHRTCPELKVYSDKVRILKEKYFRGKQKKGKKFVIFLASDDPSAIDEAEEFMSEDTWVWQPIDRARYVNGRDVDNNPELFQDKAMDELYFDLWAISQCRVGFVASFASSVAWNAYALAAGRHGYYVPFISVDWPWGHKILGGHHAKDNLFDGTISEDELTLERPKLITSSMS